MLGLMTCLHDGCRMDGCVGWKGWEKREGEGKGMAGQGLYGIDGWDELQRWLC